MTTHNHVHTLIIGAGLSGIGLGYYMQRSCPDKRYLILESRQSSGGTWDLFKYPGIRSDSDLFTFGYEFKPWEDKKAIADGASILSYIRETASENKIDQHIRYGCRVVGANWDSSAQIWDVTIEHQQGETKTLEKMTCNWIFSAAGYYNYEKGYAPSFSQIENYQGQVVHPQHWPESLEYTNKKVVIIGSGATAVTLLPAMADETKHITMLQRTPTYVMSMPESDPIANLLRALLPKKLAYQLTRRKNIGIARMVWRFCHRFPTVARKIIRFSNKQALPKDYPIEKHFNPPYNPWDQRLCAVPDGDLFKAISDGRASVVTDTIKQFTSNGIELSSGQHLDADIVVTATGLNVQLFGGIQLSIDGEAVQYSDTVAYKGMMLSGIPNFAFAIGYTNSSWTLKVGLLCEHYCRLINHMDQQNLSTCCPELPFADMPTRPLLDFGAGYVQRVLKDLPRQGFEAPWYMSMDYKVDLHKLRKGPVKDAHLRFSPPLPKTKKSAQPEPVSAEQIDTSTEMSKNHQNNVKQEHTSAA